MIPRIRPHLSFANVVSLMALFIALGGVSYAAVKLPKNSVGSKQIKKNAVTGSKVRNSSLTGADIKNSSLRGGDIRNSSLTGADVKDGSLAPEDFNGSVQGPAGPQGAAGAKGDTGAAGATGAAATRLWARVATGGPSVLNGSGVTTVSDSGYSAGSTEVTFDRDVSQCSFQATLVGRGGGYLSPTVTIGVTTGFYAGSSLTNNQVRVTTYLNGAPADRDFDIAAFC